MSIRPIFGVWQRREYRTLMIGSAAIVSILVFGRLLPGALRKMREDREHLALIRDQWALTERNVRSLGRTSDSVRARQRRLGDAFSTILHGVTTSSHAASMSELIHDAAESSGIRLGTVDIRADSLSRKNRQTEYAYPRAALNATGDVRGVMDFLASLEAGEARLRVLELRITQPEPYAQANQSEALQLYLMVEGVARKAKAL